MTGRVRGGRGGPREVIGASRERRSRRAGEMQSMLAGGGNQGGLGPESRCQWGGRGIRGRLGESVVPVAGRVRGGRGVPGGPGV